MIRSMRIMLLAGALSVVSTPIFAIDYLYKFTGGVNYWGTGQASGQLGGFKLADNVNGVNYHYSGTRLGLWANAKSGLIILPNLKFRYQDVAYNGTGDIATILNLKVGNIDMSKILGEVESNLDLSYFDMIASVTLPIDVLDLDVGAKLRVHTIEYSISELGGDWQSEEAWLPIPFLYFSAEKSLVDDNLTFVGEYAVLPVYGVVFETIDVFARYKLPVENYFPFDMRVQAGFQSFNFTIADNSSLNAFSNSNIQFGFNSIVVGVVAAF